VYLPRVWAHYWTAERIGASESRSNSAGRDVRGVGTVEGVLMQRALARKDPVRGRQAARAAPAKSGSQEYSAW